MNVRQQLDETDEEFAQRLKDLGQVTVSEDQIISAAEQYNRDKLRDRVRELSRNSVMTSNAIKDLSADEVFEVNKRFSIIKDAFLKLYGFNNPSVVERDLTELFRNAIEANPFEAALREAEKAGVTPPLAISREAASRSAAAEEEPPIQARALSRIYTNEQAVTDPKKSLLEWLAVHHPKLRIDSELTVKQFETHQQILQAMINKGIYDPSPEALEQLRRKKIELTPRSATREDRPITSPPLGSALSGFGIKHDIPNLVDFGRVKISPKKLYYSNVLSVKHKSGASFNGVPNIRVSDGFVAIIMNLLKGQKPTIKDFNALDLNEKGVYDTLIQTAGLGKEVDNTFNETKKQLKNRLELVEGEIGAGNTNPDLKAELHHLLGSMAHSGMIGHTDARRHYMNVTGGKPSVTKQRKKRLL
jgi:hypothetical protein